MQQIIPKQNYSQIKNSFNFKEKKQWLQFC